MTVVTERFNPLLVGVNATANIAGNAVGGFLAITSGTLTITKQDGTALVTAFPVTAGVFHPIPFYIGHNGGTITTAGGASGVLGV